MVCANFNFKLIQIFFYVLLLRANFWDLKGEIKPEIDKYSFLAQKNEAKIDPLMAKVQELETKYASDEFIDRL